MEQRPNRKKALVIGLGNRLSGDDAFGPLVIDLLRQSGLERAPSADLLDAGTDLLGQIDRLASYELVILVDAVLDPRRGIGPPGKIVTLEEERFVAWPETSPSVHEISPLLALKLFRNLHPQAKTKVVLAALCVNEVRMGRTSATCLLSRRLAPEAAEEVRRLLFGL